MAQLAWTLRQDPAIEALPGDDRRRAVPLPGGGQRRTASTAAREYDPAGFQASPLLYGLRDGLLVSGAPSGAAPVERAAGHHGDLGLRSSASASTATAAAGVTPTAHAVLVAPVSGSAERQASRPSCAGATDLLRPAWDFADRLWVVDRTAAAPRVSWSRR